VLLTVRDLKPAEIREKLLAVGIPSLWIPKIVKRVEKIPILGSGKLDLGACQALVAKLVVSSKYSAQRYSNG
jgi:acyl-[acyl-carrier-protein]-phospholipid O-acyltransferase / long-chain-fatty-acid--[acyl-carrier-protein] ligase